ncbi:hypothetical protein Hanom_Chr09g00843621 [Helianthus anomalus]
MVSGVSISTTVLCLVRYQLWVRLTFVSVLVFVKVSDRFVYRFLYQSFVCIGFQYSCQ